MERKKDTKLKAAFEMASGTSGLKGNGRGVCIRDHTHTDTHTHKYFELFQGALMKLSR